MQAYIGTGCDAQEIQDERCQSYILCQLTRINQVRLAAQPPRSGPAITISYQTGSGEHEVARQLAGLLQQTETSGAAQWLVFDGQLIEKVLREQRLPMVPARLMVEDSRTYVQDLLEELFGLRPPSWVIVPQIAKTIRQLAEAGHVILVGRGANFITSRLPNVLRVRLIASLPERIARVQRLNHLTAEEAAQFVRDRDRGRARYMKAHFHARSNDESLYHLVINTDNIPCTAAAHLIADTARSLIEPN